MHVHTVLVSLADPLTSKRCQDVMESMRGKVDGMIDLRVDVNELAGAYSADIALTTTWTDLEAYHAYESDAVHLEVRAVVLDLMSAATTIDYTATS